MSTPLVIIGGGEHARVVIEAARSDGRFEVVGFVDPQPCTTTASRLALPRLGDDEVGFALARRGGHRFVLGVGAIGVSTVREAVVDRYRAAGAAWAQVVHARAWVSPTAAVDEGAVVFAGAMVNSGARVGRHVVVNTGAIVEHDVQLGEYAQVGPAAAIGGGASIGARCYLGLGSRVRDHVTVGDGAVVAMGAAVVGAVTAGSIVMGVPATMRAAKEPAE